MADNNEKLFTIRDNRTDSPYMGIENVPSHHGNLMLAEPLPGQKHWTQLEVNEKTQIKDNLCVVRVK